MGIVPSALGKELAESVDIPVIGIGAGPDTDAQVLVLHDMLGISRKLPKFSKNYLEQCTSVQEAINKFGEDVRKVSLEPEHCFN